MPSETWTWLTFSRAISRLASRLTPTKDSHVSYHWHNHNHPQHKSESQQRPHETTWLKLNVFSLLKKKNDYGTSYRSWKYLLPETYKRLISFNNSLKWADSEISIPCSKSVENSSNDSSIGPTVPVTQTRPFLHSIFAIRTFFFSES